MYQVFIDDTLIYDPNVKGLDITNAKLNLELNKTGSFTFTIVATNPYINQIKKLKSIVRVYQDDYLLFRGRVLNDTESFNKSRNINCEGELAFLLDSIQRPFDFSGTPSELFTQLINDHNQQVNAEKQFKVGRCTVVDSNSYIARSDTEYTDTLTLINKQLIDTLDGYLFVRHEADGNYIDYLADFDTLNSQSIEFGKNLLDISQITKGESIATAVIPLGSKLETMDEQGNTQQSELRLTIKDVNGGVDYLFNAEAVERYGWIFTKVVYDDVTDPNNLLRKGLDYLSDVINLVVSIDLKAVDLAGLNKDITNFRIGSYVHIFSLPHEIDQNMLVKKLTIDLFRPSFNKLSLGVTYKSFLDDQVNLNSSMGNIVTQVENITNNYATNITQIENNVQSLINQSSDEIMLKVQDDYYRKDETDSLVSSMSTELNQTAERFEFTFNEFNKELNDLNGTTNDRFNELKSFIRLEGGNIVLGESGNELTLKLENDKIVFMDNQKEIAYFSNKKLYITDAEVLNSIKIGSYAFIPRENGNLSFRKVGK